MIYLIAGGLSIFFSSVGGLGSSALLRPLMDAVSPLPVYSVAMLCAMAALCASLVNAFFALSQPLPLMQDDLLLIAGGSALGGVLGDLASSRFLTVLPQSGSMLLQNALLIILLALPMLYFDQLSRSLRPLGLSRMMALPAAMLIGLFGGFLAFGAEPLSLMLFYYLFDATEEEAAFAAIEIALFSMLGKTVTLLIRQRFVLPDADALLWLLPGAILGALAAMAPRLLRNPHRAGRAALHLGIYTALLNIAASLA